MDYLFQGGDSPAEVYTFTLPMPANTGGAAAAPTATSATNDAAGGTSGMTTDNDSTSPDRPHSIYFGTLGKSTACGTTYCAVKLTQSALN